MRRTIEVRVNGADRSGEVEAHKNLADFLREDLGLTGTHVGCEHGVCGACTVLLDGEPVRACLLGHHGLQCGFCTPGILLTAKALLEKNPRPTETEIREAIAGNLCRCPGNHFIVEAIRVAAAAGPG